MENWMWISLYVVQTIVGAVLWRKYAPKEGTWRIDSGLLGIVPSCLILPNVYMIIVYFFKFLDNTIDYLAGVKNKTEIKNENT
jgi:hypothetical protein